MTDVLSNGQKFRTLNVMDDYNREALLIEPSYSLPTQKVTWLVDQLAIKKGYPREIRVDNGPEFAAIAFKKWAALHKVQINYIQPGKPAQNGFIERFNRTYRDAVLDMIYLATCRKLRILRLIGSKYIIMKDLTNHWLACHHVNSPFGVIIKLKQR